MTNDRLEADERLRDLERDMAVVKTNMKRAASDIDALHTAIEDFKKTSFGRFITKERYGPVEKGFYGIATAIILGFIGLVYKIGEWLSHAFTSNGS